ncbi:conserved hypothetical protein [Sporisorium reilianum SRZ2]|uniref:Uncharacterized protein n=1 Tax=Sporisorium reilianum (strain SRZ2) TaxID=999809 RepID=E6ZLK3_SPORE|nr:conserved hypothetical protein [Sporisorium reilianum SRZ2]
MKLPLALLYLALTTCSLAAPIPLELPEASVGDSVQSFESAFSQLEDKMQSTAQKHRAFGVREKWITGTAAVLTTLGTTGYIVSSAIPEAKRQQQAATLRRLKAAVANAKAKAKASTSAAGQGVQRIKVKRGAADALKGLEGAAKAVAEHEGDDAESFHSALSRSSSMRIGDFDDAAPHAPPTPSPRLARSRSWPLTTAASTQTPSQTAQDRLVQDNLDTHLRLSALESALLDVRMHQHDDQVSKLSPFTKAMIGIALINAAGGVASAELSVEGAVESSRGMGALPDVKNLDVQTCKEYAKTLDGLDCAKAHGTAVKAA